MLLEKIEHVFGYQEAESGRLSGAGAGDPAVSAGKDQPYRRSSGLQPGSRGADHGLHLAFDLPKDKIIWDVGHQAYTHKILSGRKDGFDDLRQFGGMSGFPKRKESPYDAFDTGHSSTSISAGLGIALGRDIRGEDYRVVSVIGDGALTGGWRMKP